MPSLEMNQECIYCGRVLPIERLSQRKDGWICADTEECLEFQTKNSVDDSTHPSEDLQKWFREIAEKLIIIITTWDYKVGGSQLKDPPSIRFSWEGWTPRPGNNRVQVSGEFIVTDKDLIEDWGDHPFKVGEVSLYAGGENILSEFLSVDIRVNKLCCDEICKALTMGFISRDKDSVHLTLNLHPLSELEREKLKDDKRYGERYREDKDLLRIRSYEVSTGRTIEQK